MRFDCVSAVKVCTARAYLGEVGESILKAKELEGSSYLALTIAVGKPRRVSRARGNAEWKARIFRPCLRRAVLLSWLGHIQDLTARLVRG